MSENSFQLELSKLRRKAGAVLIEFAFAIPVFLVLIYYIHDLPKYKLLKRKMQFVAYESAAIIQNIAKQRNTQQKVFTCQDLTYVARLAYLSLFPGTTQYCTKSPQEDFYMSYGYLPTLQIHYIVGTGEGNAERKWNCRTHTNGPGIYKVNPNQKGYNSFCVDAGPASAMLPNLNIRENEVKIIVECALWNSPGTRFANEVLTSTVSKRELFRFLLYTPRAQGVGGESKKYDYFPTTAIFTPSVGFTNTVPPNN